MKYMYNDNQLFVPQQIMNVFCKAFYIEKKYVFKKLYHL